MTAHAETKAITIFVKTMSWHNSNREGIGPLRVTLREGKKLVLNFRFLLILSGCSLLAFDVKKDSIEQLLRLEIDTVLNNTSSSGRSKDNQLKLQVSLKNISEDQIWIYYSFSNPSNIYKPSEDIGAGCYEYKGRSEAEIAMTLCELKPGYSFVDTLIITNCTEFSGEISLIYKYGVFDKKGRRLTHREDQLFSNRIDI